MKGLSRTRSCEIVINKEEIICDTLNYHINTKFKYGDWDIIK